MSWCVTVASYNIMIPVQEPLRLNGQRKRIDLLPAAIAKMDKQENIDVLCLQELIPPEYRSILLKELYKRGWKYVTKPLNTSYFSGKVKLVSGGVVICSKYPIITEYQSVFDTECVSEDCMACKGVMYARILLPGDNIVNVFSSHFQAWDLPKTREIRQQQTQQCFDFIQSLNLSPDEPVIFTGDLNTDFYSKQREITQLFNTLNMQTFDLKESSHPFSSDPMTNVLMGNDETIMYATQKYPNGCYDEYMKTLSCPCCPRELLDYVLFSTAHLKPKEATSHVYQLKLDNPVTMKLNVTTERTISDLSDHYPLIGRITFRQPAKFQHRKISSDMVEQNPQSTSFIISIALVLFLILIVVGVLIYIFS